MEYLCTTYWQGWAAVSTHVVISSVGHAARCPVGCSLGWEERGAPARNGKLPRPRVQVSDPAAAVLKPPGQRPLTTSLRSIAAVRPAWDRIRRSTSYT